MKSITAVLIALCLVSGTSRTIRADEMRRIEVQGVDRLIDVHVPTRAAAKPLPLVIALHGLNGSGPNFRSWFNLDAVADREGFVASYPTALGGRWGYGKALADPIVKVGGALVDDIELMERLAATLVRENIVDPKRIYIVGSSNGGLMAYRFACEKPRMLAAVAALIIGMTAPQMEGCSDHTPLPILILGGTADRIHYEGRPFRGGRLQSMFETVWFWRQRNGCTTRSEQELPDLEKNDGSTVTLFRYKECQNGADIDYFLVEGGKHDLPRIKRDPSERLQAGENRDIETAEEVWRFFRRYKR